MAVKTMRVYHFLNEKYGLEAIKKGRLKISRMDDLNDPFEFLAVNLGNKEFRNAMRQTVAGLNQKYGLICFSKNWSNPLLWSHYANRHRGICLGFDVPRSYLSEITYIDKRIKAQLNNMDSHDIEKWDEKMMKKWLNSKLIDWKYEAEIRAYVSLQDRDADEGLYFLSFDENTTLREVVLGHNNPLKGSEVNEILGHRISGVTLTKARAAFQSFKVVQQRCKKLWW